jgi:hypothetical protein
VSDQKGQLGSGRYRERPNEKNRHYDGDTEHGRRADLALTFTLLVVTLRGRLFFCTGY